MAVQLLLLHGLCLRDLSFLTDAPMMLVFFSYSAIRAFPRRILTYSILWRTDGKSACSSRWSPVRQGPRFAQPQERPFGNVVMQGRSRGETVLRSQASSPGRTGRQVHPACGCSSLSKRLVAP